MPEGKPHSKAAKGRPTHVYGLLPRQEYGTKHLILHDTPTMVAFAIRLENGCGICFPVFFVQASKMSYARPFPRETPRTINVVSPTWVGFGEQECPGHLALAVGVLNVAPLAAFDGKH